MQDIRDVVGSKARYFPLKPLEKRIRNRLKKPEKRQPIVRLVVTAKGRKYKLLMVGNKNKKHVLRMLRMKRYFDTLNFVPKIVWKDDKSILVEFIEGKFPDFKDDIFARWFGKHLAVIHNIDVSSLAAEKLIDDVRSNIEFLRNSNMLSSEMGKRVFAKVKSTQPDNIRTSMVYANMNNMQNFVFSNDNKLYFIDLGSFQTGRITDEFLFGSKLYKQIDLNVFKKSYLGAGGTKYIIENEEFMRIIHSISRGAHQLRGFQTLSSFDWRKRRSRLLKAKAVIDALKAEIE